MELGRGRHYQFYPFLNLGHYYLAISSHGATREKYLGYMKDALEHLKKRAGKDPFMYGVPFLWCSNNLVSAAITHAHLYREASGDDSYLEMEMALRDWLFGTNPWGTSMIVGVPEGRLSWAKIYRNLWQCGLHCPGSLRRAERPWTLY